MLSDWQFQFSEPLPWWLLILIFTAVLVFTSFTYWKIRKRLSKRLRLFLLILRGLVLILLILFLLQPRLSLHGTRTLQPIVVLLIDDSASMGLRDMEGNETRFERVRRLFSTRERDFLQRLERNYLLKPYTFSDSIRAVEWEKLFSTHLPQGLWTDLGRSLSQIKEEFKGQPLAGVFLISDGAHNGPENLGRVAEDFNLPIHTIGVGDPQGFVDLQIANLATSDFAFIRTAVDLEVTIRAFGFLGQEVPVVLKRGGEAIKIARIKIEREGEERRVPLSFTPKEVGTFHYTVSIPKYAQDMVPENNSRDFTLQVIRDKIRVLYICGMPGWEYKFLRRLLKKDPNIELVSFNILRTPFDIADVPERELSLIPFPIKEIFLKEIFNYDLLIFENFSFRPYLSLSYLANIKKFVEEGGAFLMIGGESSFGSGGYGNTPIEDILPVAIGKTRLSREKKSFRMRLTPQGTSHPILTLNRDPQISARLWGAMPALWGCNQVLRAKPRATILGVHPWRKNEYGNLVILAVQEYEKGRTMALTANTTWRWNFGLIGEGKSNRAYFNFWRQAIRWLIKAPELKLVRIKTNKNEYLPGERAEIAIRAYDRYYRPNQDAYIKLKLILPSGKVVRLDSISSLEKPGEFESEYLVSREGSYRVEVEAWERGVNLGSDRKTFMVKRPDLEWENANLNEKLLKNISGTTGGRYYHIADPRLKSISFDFPPLKPEVIEEKGFELWDTPFAFLLLVVLLSGEWFIRKRSGLS